MCYLILLCHPDTCAEQVIVERSQSITLQAMSVGLLATGRCCGRGAAASATSLVGHVGAPLRPDGRWLSLIYARRVSRCSGEGGGGRQCIPGRQHTTTTAATGMASNQL